MMLDKKTLYVVYLLHKASSICFENPRAKNGKLCLSYEEARLLNYLHGPGRITHSQDVTSLVSLLNEVGKMVDPLLDSSERRAEFPRTVYQFNRGYKQWLSSIESSRESLNS
ncbi:hypothetical protein [Bacteroides sp. 519]|uniref:hypothetical protein n=1 Tax=Bacteroides sp. 519 TaxID=2302937 RepID=UPI0013D35157|nr:hypothetical protein [Bacteroides sp. 519]NDV60562.1 hypothetical protein [Bacteroides sp. 519]